MSIINHNS